LKIESSKKFASLGLGPTERALDDLKTWGESHMMESSATKVFLIVILVGLPCPVRAYVDPGTGSAVFGVLSYILAAGAAAAVFLFGAVRRWLTSLISRRSDKTK
jgi:hypothetical protein